MAVPQDKAELIEAIDRSSDRLIEVLRTIPADQADQMSLEGHAQGTRMSVANLVAYLVGWNELVLKWLERDAAGLPIDFPDTGFKWNELGRLAGKFYRDYEALTYGALLDRLAAAKTRIIEEVERRSDEDLYGRPWCGKWPMGRMIQFNSASPYANARARLKKRGSQTESAATEL